MPTLTRRECLEALLSTVAASQLPLAGLGQREAHGAAPLAPLSWQPLPLGSIKPAGWLQRQLRIQADGLSGHLDEFWPDLGPNSGWLGGTGESWERGPYYVDGLLPLAWQLDDPKLKQKVMRFIDWTLDHQAASGMIGPAMNADWWPRMVMAKALMQYSEATNDRRVVPVLTRYFHYQLANLKARPLQSWGRYRWQDELLVLVWLYERTADPKLIQLAELLTSQGFDWVGSFRKFRHTGVTSRRRLAEAAARGDKTEAMETHGINNGQALKTSAVTYRLHGDLQTARADFFRQLRALDTYHGQPNGMFSCDEHLAGLDPSHGTELCTVVETLYSLEVALAAFGDVSIADRIEKIAYNALPGTFDDQMWTHQYDQQANQIQVGLLSKPWTTNGPESNLYGLEPNFGCCTANFHQGWPKFVSHLWMRSPDGGLAACLYAPCTVTTMIAGQRVSVHVETQYPFKEQVRLRLICDAPIKMPLHLRIPTWAASAVVKIGEHISFNAVPGTYVAMNRVWSSGDAIDLHFSMPLAIDRGYHNAITLTRGPLVFSLDPGSDWVKLRDRPPTADWQVFPEHRWNYALRVNERSLDQVAVYENLVDAVPYAAKTPPVHLCVNASLLASWQSQDGVALPLPQGLQHRNVPTKMLKLIPYGAAKLRVTAFPEHSQDGQRAATDSDS